MATKPGVKVTAIPAFTNNYFWLIQPCPQDSSVYVVDPGDAEPVMACLAQEQLKLAGLLITHHHTDHIGGIEKLRAHWPVPVYGPISANIPQVTHPVQPKEPLNLSSKNTDLTLNVIAVPGHTMDHIAYFHAPAQATPSLFCGDSLFAGGCGRRFEGSAEIMWGSLERLAELPDETLIYCAHEYTLSNLAFAVTIEPSNLKLVERLEQVKQQRAQGIITLPSTLGLEKRTNPFLRCHLPHIKKRVEELSAQTLAQPLNHAWEVFGELRRLKDHWQ